MREKNISKKDKILIALTAADFALDRLVKDCIVTVFLSKSFEGNVDSTSGRWGGFVGKHLLFLKNHGTIHQIPVDHIEKIVILELSTKVVTEISF